MAFLSMIFWFAYILAPSIIAITIHYILCDKYSGFSHSTLSFLPPFLLMVFGALSMLLGFCLGSPYDVFSFFALMWCGVVAIATLMRKN